MQPRMGGVVSTTTMATGRRVASRISETPSVKHQAWTQPVNGAHQGHGATVPPAIENTPRPAGSAGTASPLRQPRKRCPLGPSHFTPAQPDPEAGQVHPAPLSPSSSAAWPLRTPERQRPRIAMLSVAIEPLIGEHQARGMKEAGRWTGGDNRWSTAIRFGVVTSASPISQLCCVARVGVRRSSPTPPPCSVKSPREPGGN